MLASLVHVCSNKSLLCCEDSIMLIAVVLPAFHAQLSQLVALVYYVALFQAERTLRVVVVLVVLALVVSMIWGKYFCFAAFPYMVAWPLQIDVAGCVYEESDIRHCACADVSDA